MWIYQQPGSETSCTIPDTVDALVPAPLPAEAPSLPSPENVSPARQPHTACSSATRDCGLLAAAYLLGSLAAGFVQAFRDARQIELLGYYLDAWRGLFAVNDLQHAAQLFGTEYLALAAAVSALLLLGLSALGPVLIFLFMMLYGLGNGLLFLQLVSAGGSGTFFSAFLWTCLPAAVASGCLCLFGASALQVSSRLHAYSFRNKRSGQSGPGVRALLGQYLLTMVTLLPLCGAATALSYLF